MVGFSLYLYLRRISPFPAFSFRNNVGDPFWEDRETALMRCLHHLRAASGEWSNLYVGLVATTPLFEEETYRKVCRMGRDVPFSAKMNHAHLHQGAILGHPAWHVLMALFLQVSSSLAPMQYTGVCRIAQMPNEGGYWASGERSSFHGTSAVWKERSIWWRLSCLIISIYIYYYCII